ncbi:hypothetical protein [Moorella sulfitireducens (nom. illeg.)]|nr:hypothetical protein [Moorella sulfitireducens]
MPRRFKLSRNGPNQERRSKVRARELHAIRGNQIIIDPERGPENK